MPFYVPGYCQFLLCKLNKILCRKVFLQVNIAYNMDAALLMNMFIGIVLNV